jgi:hypothetical protein
MNGEDEAVKIVQEMKERVEETEDQAVSPAEKVSDLEDDIKAEVEHSDDDLEVVGEPEDSAEDTIEVAKPKRGRPKGSRTKS